MGRRLDRDTPLLPRIVAESICAEAANWLEDDRPMAFAPALAARATRLYARNPSFTRRLRAPGNKPKCVIGAREKREKTLK